MAAKSNRTTFAKLDRERRLREKRAEKKARREARKENPPQWDSPEPDPWADPESPSGDEDASQSPTQP